MVNALILSNALDTNGQNARYVRAAEKHGDDVRIVHALAIGNVDPGGVVARLQEASVQHPEVGLRIRSAHKQDQYFRFPGDLSWGHNAPKGQRAEVRQLAYACHVMHLNNSDRGLFELGMSKSQKPVLLHHHGTLFRNNTERMLGIARQYKMVQAVSTIDLQKPAPDLLHWLPTAYDIGALQKFGKSDRQDDRIRIGHFPTNRELKYTDLFIEAVRELQEEGLPLDLVPGEFLTEKKDWLPRWTWAQTMAAKADCDILYDQLNFGYGCNAVEAWGMGIPVIAGADHWTIRRMVDLWGTLPFVAAQPMSLKGIIRKMVKSEQMRKDAAAVGLAHVLKYHDELPALEILAGLYHDAMAVRAKPRIQGKGVTFNSTRHKPMDFAGVRVDFSKGPVEVTDVEVVAKLRATAKARPAFGITEEEGVA